MIHATVYVERDSQKPIVLGAGGARLRDVGTAARREIEALLGGRVYLDLHVTVLKDWQRDPRQLAPARASEAVLLELRTGGCWRCRAAPPSRWPASWPDCRSPCRRSASCCSSRPPAARTGWPARVSATFLVAGAAAAPVLGRLVDRIGQARVLLGALAVHTVGLVGLVVLVLADAPAWSLFPAAVVAGGSYAQPGSLVRARWSHVLAGQPLLPTAFSWESVVDEVIFVVGPVLVTVLATGIAPAAGLLTAYCFTLIGCLALAVQRRTQPPPHPVAAGDRRGVGAAPARGARCWSASPSGSARSSARSRWPPSRSPPSGASRPRPGWCSRLLAGGSLVAGLWYGTVAWRAPAHRRFVVGVLLLAVATLPLPLAPNVAVLAVLVFVGGFAISPGLIAGFALLDLLVPQPAADRGAGLVQHRDRDRAGGVLVGDRPGGGRGQRAGRARRHGGRGGAERRAGPARRPLAAPARGAREAPREPPPEAAGGAAGDGAGGTAGGAAGDGAGGTRAAAAAAAGGTAKWETGPVSLYRDEAVVLRVQKLGEADRIVTLLTRRNGRVRAVGKGVRRTTCRFGARLEPFSHVDLQLYDRPVAGHRDPGE